MSAELQPQFFAHPADESAALILGEWLRTHYVIEDQAKWKYTVGSMPDDDINRIVLTDTAPQVQSQRSGRTGITPMRPGVQIRLRCLSYQLGYRKALAIMRTLDTIQNESISIETDIYCIRLVSQTSGVLVLGKDERERWNFTFNVLLTLAAQGD